MELLHFSPVGGLTVLDPECSLGAQKRVWFVTPGGAEWAIAHVCAHQHRKPTELFCYRVKLPRRKVRRWRRGVWVCYERVGDLTCTQVQLTF